MPSRTCAKRCGRTRSSTTIGSTWIAARSTRRASCAAARRAWRGRKPSCAHCSTTCARRSRRSSPRWRCCASCAARGLKLYGLSNMSATIFAYLDGRHDFFKLFDGIVVSAAVKLLKPEPAIYEHLRERFELDFAESVFIDDMTRNVESARGSRVARHPVHEHRPSAPRARGVALDGRRSLGLELARAVVAEYGLDAHEVAHARRCGLPARRVRERAVPPRSARAGRRARPRPSSTWRGSRISRAAARARTATATRGGPSTIRTPRRISCRPSSA